MSTAAGVLDRSAAVPLTEVGIGGSFVIEAIDGSHGGMLRDLGFCESALVKKLVDGRNLICVVCGTRMAISRELASEVKVVPSRG